jgi:hypothetical protein
MTRRLFRSASALLAAATMISVVAMPAFADPGKANDSKQRSPQPRIQVKVGKVTKSPDTSAKSSNSSRPNKK